jgi:hypothetical protein
MNKQFSRRLMPVLAVLVLFGVFPSAAQTQPAAEPRLGLYDSVWPHGRSDAWRSGAARGAGLPADFDPGSLTTMSVELPIAPVWAAVYSDDAVFVMGGSPFLLKQFTYATLADAGRTPDAWTKMKVGLQAVEDALIHPYLAKIDPKTMTVIDTVEFPRGDTVNYVGSMLIHENGKIYGVATSRLYEVDPATMEVRTLDLPKYESKWVGTVYNTLQVSPRTGDIVVKGTNLLDQTLPSRLLSVNASDLAIRFQSEVPIGATRIALAVQGDTEYVYASNSTSTLRFAIGDSGFQADDAWSKVYRKDGDGTTPAVGMAYMGDRNRVVFPNNNTVIFGVTKPLKLFTQQTDTTDGVVTSVDATSATGPGGSFYSAAADPFESMMLVENDQINGITAGWRLMDDGTLTKVWETDSYRSTGGTAIGVDQGHFYIDDRRCDDSGDNCELFLVVLDLTTGQKLAEAKVAGVGPTIGQIFLNGDSVFFVATEPGEKKGFLTKVSVK